MVSTVPFDQRSIGRDAAIALAESRWWIGKPEADVFAFQMHVKELCMDFGEFHRVTEAALNRPVWTHEFAEFSSLWSEFIGTRKAPSFEEIVAKIPSEKLLVFVPAALSHAATDVPAQDGQR